MTAPLRPRPSLAAVLTGDLIGSTKVGRDRLEHTMQLIADEARWRSPPWSWPVQGTRFTRFRGDGWQMLVDAPHLALRHAIFLIAALRSDVRAIPSRIAIGIGTVTSPGTLDLRDAAGEAFTASGRCLDLLQADETLSMMGPEPPAQTQGGPETGAEPVLTQAEGAVVLLINERLSRWTPEQSEAAALYLHPQNPTLKDIAEKLGITPQAVGYRVRGAGAPALREALARLETGWESRWKGECR